MNTRRQPSERQTRAPGRRVGRRAATWGKGGTRPGTGTGQEQPAERSGRTPGGFTQDDDFVARWWPAPGEW